MSTPRRQTRQRLRIACDPCRDRKRKCDGSRPCNMCLGYGYECSYRSMPRTRRSQASIDRSQTTVLEAGSPSTAAPATSRRLERRQCDGSPVRGLEQLPEALPTQVQGAQISYLRPDQLNSGAAFVRLFTTTLESKQSVSPMRMLAWNLFLGERQHATVTHAESVIDILTEVEMQNLARAYFARFHPCYGFIDNGMLFRSISRTWNEQDRSVQQDAMLCGVAAIGSLFSSTSDLVTEQRLVVLAKRLLDPSDAGTPSLRLSTAWLLRSVYLRLTAKPEEAWQASCTTLHVIAATDFTSGAGTNDLSLSDETQNLLDTRRSLIGVAQHLNIWLSYDLGRSRVVLPDLDAFPIAAKPGEYTAELLGLLPYSQVLDPTNRLSSESLLATLEEVLDRTHTEPPSVLAQCNLALCVYRRLHSSNLEITEEVRHKVFSQMKKSIRAVHSAIAQGLPWHHVANMPFQILCLLLYVDTVQSFAILNEALSCIVAVNNAYQTEATLEAATAANTLVQLHRKRREAEIQNHTEMLNLYPSLDPQIHETQAEFLSGDALQDSWWFNQFMAQSEWMSSTLATLRSNMAKRLSSKFPWLAAPFVVAAPMRVMSGPELALAVSRAGGLGFIGPGVKPEDTAIDLARAARLLNTKAGNTSSPSAAGGVLPVGIGFQLWNGDLDSATQAVREHRPCAAWLFAPREGQQELNDWIDALREASPDIDIWVQVGTLQESLNVANSHSRPDVLVIQGAEAGGHGIAEGGMGLISLLPEVSDAISRVGIAIFAAGGIADGRGVAAALALGADGVALGTRFLASTEARISKGYQQEIVRASDGAKYTVRTTLYNQLRGTKWPEQYSPRGIVNKSWHEHEAGVPFEELKRLHDDAVQAGDSGWGPEGRLATYAGAAIGLVNGVEPASVLVERLRRETKAIIQRLSNI
ncbi:2-nitropropane dioxygenase [Stagonosporopsis vannaccii]|nr:2-nitropropane dioxygenase [Stagonosporopsis vannaccii]